MTMLQGKSVAVVGAGVSGLAAAHQLQQRGAKVTVFEKCDYVGGRTRTVRQNGFVIDTGALTLMPTYENMQRLSRETGIDKQLLSTKPSMAILRNGKRHVIDFNNRLGSALSMKLLSVKSQLALLKLAPIMWRYRSTFHYENMGELADLDHETTRAFCHRVLTEEIDDYLASPTIRAGSLVSSAQAPVGDWLWQLAGYRAPNMLQFDEGMDTYARALASNLNVKLSTDVKRVSNENGKAVLDINGTRQTFDAAVMAITPPAALALTSMVTPQQQEFFASVKSSYLICIHLGLSKKPDIDQAMLLLPEKEAPDLLLILLDHNKLARRAPEGKGVVTVWATIEWSRAHENASDEEIIAKLSRLAEPFIGKTDGLVEVALVSRWDHVCAATEVGFFTKLRDYMQTRNLNQPLFFSGDYVAEGIEGATVSGLQAARHVEQFLACDSSTQKQ